MSTIIKSEEAFKADLDYVITRPEVTTEQVQQTELLTRLLRELQKLNIHQAKISGLQISDQDLEEDLQ